MSLWMVGPVDPDPERDRELAERRDDHDDHQDHLDRYRDVVVPFPRAHRLARDEREATARLYPNPRGVQATPRTPPTGDAA